MEIHPFSVNTKEFGVIFANAICREQADFLKGFVAELYLWESMFGTQTQFVAVASYLEPEEKAMLLKVARCFE